MDSRPLGDPTITAPGPNQFVLIGTNAATPYPETVNRTHELAFVLKYKLTNNFTPRLEYRYQQWDNRDYQTSAMTPYMGCVSPIPNGPSVTNSVPGCTTPILTTNTPNPVGVPSPFYPGFVDQWRGRIHAGESAAGNVPHRSGKVRIQEAHPARCHPPRAGCAGHRFRIADWGNDGDRRGASGRKAARDRRVFPITMSQLRKLGVLQWGGSFC